MAKPSDSRRYKNTDQKLARYLIETRLNTSKALRQAKNAMKTGDITINEKGEPQEIELFRTYLEHLVEWYYTRTEYIDKEQEKEIMPETPELDNYSYEELKELYYEVIELQEELGHTTIESREYKKRDLGRD